MAASLVFASRDSRCLYYADLQIAALPRKVLAVEITAKRCVRLDICEGSKRSLTGVDWPKSDEAQL